MSFLVDTSVFVLANLKDTDAGRSPDLPPEVSFQEIATPHRHAGFRLYACYPPEAILRKNWPGVEILRESLQNLLKRAERHSTALPRARERLLRELGDGTITLMTRFSFLRHVEKSVLEALKYPDAPFELEIDSLDS